MKAGEKDAKGCEGVQRMVRSCKRLCMLRGLSVPCDITTNDPSGKRLERDFEYLLPFLLTVAC